MTSKSTSNTSPHSKRISFQAARGIHACLPRVSWFRGCLRQRLCLYKELFLARLEKSFSTNLLCSIMAIATSSLSLDMARSSTFWLYLFNRISCSFADSRYDTRDAWPVVAAKFRAVFWIEKKKMKMEFQPCLYKNVRRGILTHAYKSTLGPKSSALDRSAILTHEWWRKYSIYNDKDKQNTVCPRETKV